MNKTKFIASLLLAALSAIVAFFSYSSTIPTLSELKSVTGVLRSAEFHSKRGSEIHLDGHSDNYVYRSHGRHCGNVQDKLFSAIGKPITVMYLPISTTDWGGNIRPFRIYGIYIESSSICSYAQISTMIQNDFALLPFLGGAMLLASLVVAISAIPQRADEHKPSSKNCGEIGNNLEIEEGERIIGEQWRTAPTTPHSKKHSRL